MKKRCPYCFTKNFTVHTTDMFEYTELFRGIECRHCSYMCECHVCDLQWYVISLPECTKCYRAFMYNKNKTLKIDCGCNDPDLEYTPFWFRKGREFSPQHLIDDDIFYINEMLPYPPLKYTPPPATKTCKCIIM